MVRGSGKELLSASEKEALLDQKKELESTLKEKEEWGKGTAAEGIDSGRIKAEIAHIEKAIHDREPPRLKDITKDKIAGEIRELESSLKQGMPSRDEMNHPEKNAGAVRKHIAWCQRNGQNIERYKYLQRTLNKDNPESYERLRRDK